MPTLIRCPFHPPPPTHPLPRPRVTAVARNSAKSAGCRLHLNTHTPMTQQSRSGLTIALSRHSVGTYPETSSHATCQGTFGQSSRLAEPLRTDPGIKSGISVRQRISSSKTKQTRKAQAGNEWSNSLPKSRITPPPLPPCFGDRRLQRGPVQSRRQLISREAVTLRHQHFDGCCIPRASPSPWLSTRH